MSSNLSPVVRRVEREPARAPVAFARDRIGGAKDVAGTTPRHGARTPKGADEPSAGWRIRLKPGRHSVGRPRPEKLSAREDLGPDDPPNPRRDFVQPGNAINLK